MLFGPRLWMPERRHWRLANPIAALISVPLQLNYDQNIGPDDDGVRWTLNVQPVVPIALNEDWSLISRTILPVVAQSDVAPGDDDRQDISATFLFPR